MATGDSRILLILKILRTITKKRNIKYYKKRVVPIQNEKQMVAAQTKCSHLFKKFSDRGYILDDESYFKLTHSTLNDNGSCYTSDVSTTKPIVKFATKAKFEDKILIWIVMDPKGLSRLFFRKSGFGVNGQRHLNKCIHRHLIPYIRSNYNGGDYVFLPGLTGSHYCKILLSHLRQQDITFVEKCDNPANVPKIQPIEWF